MIARGRLTDIIDVFDFAVPSSFFGRMNEPHRLATVALVACERAAKPAVERVDRGVENAPRRIEVTGAQGIRVARQTGTRKEQAVSRDSKARRRLVRLERLVITGLHG